ncbi:MAG TPA: OmpA family protein [Gemmatimonadaceae bacterium]
MKSFTRLAAVFSAALILAPTAAAQRSGTIEVGPFARYTIFDNSFNFGDWIGPGGRLGIFVLPRLAVEGDISRTLTDAEVGDGKLSYVPIHARLVYNQPVGASSQVLVGAGYARNEFRKSIDGSDDGMGALLGWRVMLSDWLAVRLDAVADYTASPVNKSPANENNWNVGLQGGVSLMLFNRTSQPRQRPVPLVVAPEPPVPPVELDSDTDGVLDSADRCPGTPAGTRVDASGCPVPVDSDGDGVLDSADGCPNTATGVRVDAAGCPVPVDSDADGVVDSADKCPNTTAGTKVDAAGCAVIFEEKKTSVVLTGVNFEFGKSVLLPEARTVLDQVASSLVANPDVRVEVAGYTDSRGSKAVNLRISQARADAVKAYLVERGVAADRLRSRGYGPANPVASNASDAGRAQNRRVELHKDGVQGSGFRGQGTAS